MSKHVEGMSVSSPLLMITLDMIIFNLFIGNLNNIYLIRLRTLVHKESRYSRS